MRRFNAVAEANSEVNGIPSETPSLSYTFTDNIGREGIRSGSRSNGLNLFGSLLALFGDPLGSLSPLDSHRLPLRRTAIENNEAALQKRNDSEQISLPLRSDNCYIQRGLLIVRIPQIDIDDVASRSPAATSASTSFLNSGWLKHRPKKAIQLADHLGHDEMTDSSPFKQVVVLDQGRIKAEKGLDPQGYQFVSDEQRCMVRERRRIHLQRLLARTRQFMTPKNEVEIKARQDGMFTVIEGCGLSQVDAWERADKICNDQTRNWKFDLIKFHAGPVRPSFDHFQLKHLLWSEGTGVYYAQLLEQDDEIPTVSRSPWIPAAYDTLAHRPAIYYYDLATRRCQRILGPWKFPLLQQAMNLMETGTPAISTDSGYIYSIAASKNYLAMADGASSLLIGRKSDNRAIDWVAGCRVSTHPLQITNSILLLENDLSVWEGANNIIDLINNQAASAGVVKMSIAIVRLDRLLQPNLRSKQHAFLQWKVFVLSKGSALSAVGPEGPDVYTRLERLRSLFAALDSPSSSPPNGFEVMRETPSFPSVPDPLSFASESTAVPSHDTLAVTVMNLPNVGNDSSYEDTPAPIQARACDNCETRPLLFLDDFMGRDGRRRFRANKLGLTLIDGIDLRLLTAGNDRTVNEFSLEYILPTGRETLAPLADLSFEPYTCLEHKKVLPCLEPVTQWRFPFCINHLALHPDKDLMLLVGDNPRSLLVSRKLGHVPMSSCAEMSYFRRMATCLSNSTSLSRPLFVLEGHNDCGFAAAWHPEGQLFATGNDDQSICIWDIRRLHLPVKMLSTATTAPRSLVFSPDGNFLASCESEDSVMIYSVSSDFRTRQEVSFFGACTGAVFSEDSKSLVIGEMVLVDANHVIGIAAPRHKGGLMEAVN